MNKHLRFNRAPTKFNVISEIICKHIIIIIMGVMQSIRM